MMLDPLLARSMVPPYVGGWRERVAVTLSSPYVVGVTGVRTRTSTSVSVSGSGRRTDMRFWWCPDTDIH